MAKKARPAEPFEARRRKEHVAFLVVKFLKAHDAFLEILREFVEARRDNRLGSSALYQKLGALGDGLAFDIKEEAHFLFRAGHGNGKKDPPARTTKRSIGELKAGIESRAMDSFIGTGYHLLEILKESLYQLERYSPQYEREQEEISRFETLARSIGYTFSPEEMGELEHLRSLSSISMNLSAETEGMTVRLMERCESLFRGTAEVLRHFIEGSAENEILVQNLLQNVGLFDTVYGEGAAERIFWVMFRRKGLDGSTGLEKATAFTRERCGNTAGIPGMGEKKPAAI
jgi:hypothetical protein